MSEAQTLRFNFARYLAPLYVQDPVKIAHLCDDELDPTGSLLGYVREAARADKEQQGPGTNTGHGHVWKRPDGHRARCGGPGICHACKKDYALWGGEVAKAEFAKWQSIHGEQD